MKPLFGVAGNPPNFWKSKYKKDRLNAPEWLHSIGLNAYEIQCTYGVKMPEESAIKMRKNAEKYDISLSIHAPYYIVLTSKSEETQRKSIDTLVRACKLASVLGTKKVVFHPGFYSGDPQGALERCITNLLEAQKLVRGLDVLFYPETTGKISQFGSLEDVMEICKKVELARPCVDFGHLHARTLGGLENKENILKVFKKIEKELGKKYLKNLHCHFYLIEYGQKGERMHKTYTDIGYFPDYKFFMEAIVEYDITPVIISEFKDSQDEGAALMRDYYNMLKSKNK